MLGIVVHLLQEREPLDGIRQVRLSGAALFLLTVLDADCSLLGMTVPFRPSPFIELHEVTTTSAAMQAVIVKKRNVFILSDISLVLFF